MKTNVLVIGSGGREHALCHQLARSPALGKLFVLPGNAGTQSLATNIAGEATNIALALEVARRENVGLTVVGPEEPLAAGIVDAFDQAGLRAFGPLAAAARLESDKAFAKQLMRQYAIPTAEARTFDDYALARQYIASRDEPLVVKAAGLAKGKGVVVCDEPSDAILVAEKMLVHKAFGAAGEQIVVEERLSGREVSVLALVDGHDVYMLEPAQDYKRLLDNDAGPNTGGMGAYCPTDWLDAATLRTVESQIIVPTLDALARDNLRYRGVLYVGLMLTPGGPKVLEFNCRLGDPEAQAILVRLESDLLELFLAACEGRLQAADVRWRHGASVCIVLASAGYPEAAQAAQPISGLERAADPDTTVFHAATVRAGAQVMTAGGRVLGVTALGETLAAARARAYRAVDQIHFPGMQYRRDIAATPTIQQPVSATERFPVGQSSSGQRD